MRLAPHSPTVCTHQSADHGAPMDGNRSDAALSSDALLSRFRCRLSAAGRQPWRWCKEVPIMVPAI